MAQSSAGLDLIGGTNTLIDCTVSANIGTAAASDFVAGIYILGTASLNDTIVAGNTGPSGASDIGGLGKASGSNNLIGTGIVSGSNNLLGVTDPLLGPLTFNGGPTQTMVPARRQPGHRRRRQDRCSPRESSPTSGAPADHRRQRRHRRRRERAARPSSSPPRRRGQRNDRPVRRARHVAPRGDRLRQRRPGGGDTIVFSPLLQGAIDLSLGTLPTITAAMTIDGPGANVLTVDGQGQSGILSIGAGANVTISGLTLADGSAAKGGAILNSGGTLALSDCTLSGNTATNGGAIYSTGTTSLTGCTLSGNSATSFGGARVQLPRDDDAHQLHRQRQHGPVVRRARLDRRHQHPACLHRQRQHRHCGCQQFRCRHLPLGHSVANRHDRRRQHRALGRSDIGGPARPRARTT